MGCDVIINYGGLREQTESLKARLLIKDKTKKISVIQIRSNEPTELTKEETDILKAVNSKSRIYILGHCSPNSSFIGDVDHNSIHYQDIAEFLKKNINADFFSKQSKYNLRISLIACNAGINNEKSFASKLHIYLGQVEKIYADIIARTCISIVNENTSIKGKMTDENIPYAIRNIAFQELIEAKQKSENTKNQNDINTFNNLLKEYKELTNQLEKHGHQRPGTKVVFSWNESGTQIKIDGYIEHFVRKLEKIRKNLFDIIKTKMDTIEGITIASALEFIQENTNINEINGEKVIELCKQLDIIKSEIKKIDGSKKQIEHASLQIEDILVFAKKSIEPTTSPAFNYGIKIDSPPSKEMQNIRELIKKDFIDPPVNELRKIPKGKSKNLKTLTTGYLKKFISDPVYSNLCREQPVDNEMFIVKYITEVIKSVTEKNYKKIQELEKSFNEKTKNFPAKYEESLAYLDVVITEAKNQEQNPD